MEAPLVTIVTPSFNQGRFIRATIESVLSQDYARVEYILMDGGSTDQTASIAAEYGSRLLFRSEPDRGQAHAINKGFREGQGEILAWLNSDDLLLPGAIKAAAGGLAAHPDAAAVYGDGDRIDAGGRTIGRFPPGEPFNLWRLLHLRDDVLQQSLFLRRKPLEEIGYLDETLHYTMDWDLLIRLGLRYPLFHLNARLGAIREYPEAKSFRGRGERLREIGRMLRRHTGRRCPPGLLLYGLETYRGPFPLHMVTGRLIDRLRREPQGLYRDGWAAPRMRYMVPPGDGPILVRGVSPWPQSIQATSNGAALPAREVDAGAFEFPIDERGLATLELRASRWFRPASNAGADRRRLSWVVREIARRR